MATSAQANMRFFSIVQQVCNSYQVTAGLDQMKLDDLETGNATFHLLLQSSRNTIEQVMVVGYIASGQAVARTGLGVKMIKVTVAIPNADNLLVMTEADVVMVEQLRLGKMKASEFMRKLSWNK
ncbi:MAG: hypothetical protein V3W14_10680 [Candidatus Neomarinimicrobiota bacterium]